MLQFCQRPGNLLRKPCLRTKAPPRPLLRVIAFKQQQDNKTAAEKYAELVMKMKDNMVVVSNRPQAASRSALLLFLPGAMMKSEQYRHVCEQVTSQIITYAPELSLTVAVPDVEAFSMIALQASLGADVNDSGSSGLPTPEELPQHLLQEALKHIVSSHGFDAKTLMGSRYLNVVTAVHSAAGMTFLDAASKMTGGVVLVQASMSGQIGGNKTKPGGWATAKVPVMILNGQEDGQNTWPAYLHDVALSSWVAARRGSIYAASHKPVIVIPGLNHGQMSGVPPSLARGDLPATAPPEQTLAEAGNAIAAFIAANFAADGGCVGKGGLLAPLSVETNQCAFGGVFAADLKPSSLQVPSTVMSTLEMYQPYAAANGMTNLGELWAAGNALDQPISPAGNAFTAPKVPFPVGIGHNTGVNLSTGGLYSHAMYSHATGRPIPAYEQPWSVGLMSHGMTNMSPELLIHAEREVADMQVQVLQRAVEAGLLPGHALSKVRVLVNLHPTQDGLMYSQPTITKMAGGYIEIQVQAFIHWPLIEKPGQMEPPALYSVSHDYWVKMKGVASVAMEVSRLLALPVPGVDACAGRELRAVDLNQRTLDKAWDMVDHAARARYETEGVHIALKPDSIISKPQSFIINSRLDFKVVEPVTTSDESKSGISTGTHAANRRVVEVTSPVVNPFAANGVVAPAPPWDMPEAMPFWGSFYAKVMSQAQAVEWIVQGSMRHAHMPPRTPCHWGGRAVPEALPQATPKT